MIRSVVFRPSAEGDLESLYDYIAEDSPKNALGFVERIRRYCLSFSGFAERGSRREDVDSGLRVVGFERRVSILFYVYPETVEIARILYGGRDLAGALDPGVH